MRGKPLKSRERDAIVNALYALAEKYNVELITIGRLALSEYAYLLQARKAA